MAGTRPDVVLVFGTGILRDPLLSTFAGRIINIHLGLSPYYRGAGTNFWPLVNREPEYVGATIHYLDAGIDTGPILAHARPHIESGDGAHDLGNKTIVAAAEALLRAAEAHVAGTARAVPQWAGGRLYQRKDFNAAAVTTMYRNFETGMIDEYLSARASRDAALRLIEQERVA
jgi:methionyl-tRNA formyltransferase